MSECFPFPDSQGGGAKVALRVRGAPVSMSPGGAKTRSDRTEEQLSGHHEQIRDVSHPGRCDLGLL